MRSVLVSLIGVLISSGVARATPMYLTFEGGVTGIVGPVPLSIGDFVTYTFIADLSTEGGDVVDGTFIPRTDGPGYDYFYALYLGGSAIPRPPTDELHSYSYGWGYEDDSPTGGLTGSPTDLYYNYVQVFADHGPKVSGWVLGQSLEGIDYYNDFYGTGGLAYVTSALSLVAVSDTAPEPVPEPGTLLLLGGGLGGLAVRRRREAIRPPAHRARCRGSWHGARA